MTGPHRLLQMLAAVLAACAPLAGASDAQAQCLYRSFDIPADSGWGLNTIALIPGEWRVGHPRGAPADEAGIRQRLAGGGRLIVGGICAGQREGDTYRACGFALAEPELAGRRYDAPPWQWVSTAGASLVSTMGDGDAGIVSVFSTPDVVAFEGAPEDFIGVQAPATLSLALRGAFGATLSFSFRTVANPLVTPALRASDGLVLLCPDRGGTFTGWRSSVAMRAEAPPR